jgi:hypothetical protein
VPSAALDIKACRLRQYGARRNKIGDASLRHDQFAAPIDRSFAQLQIQASEKAFQDQYFRNYCGDRNNREDAASHFQPKLSNKQ